MTEITRRDFVVGAAAAIACTLTIKGVIAQTTRPGASAAAAGGSFTVDPATLKEGFNDAFAMKNKVILVRKGENVYAMTSICTHQAGTLKVNGDILRCTKHQGEFDINGKASKGKAKGELSRYGILLKDGKIVVDMNKIILPGDFEKDGSFVKLS